MSCSKSNHVFVSEVALLHYRGDIVRIETYFSADGRIAARREWTIKNALTGEQLGRATRCALDLSLKPCHSLVSS